MPPRLYFRPDGDGSLGEFIVVNQLEAFALVKAFVSGEKEDIRLIPGWVIIQLAGRAGELFYGLMARHDAITIQCRHVTPVSGNLSQSISVIVICQHVIN